MYRLPSPHELAATYKERRVAICGIDREQKKETLQERVDMER